MKTDELIDTLSADPQRRNTNRPLATIALAVFLACLGAFIVSLVWFGLPTDLADVASTGDHGFFVRIAFSVSVTCCAFFVVRDLAVPGRRQRMPSLVAMAPFVFLAILALHELSSMSWDQWPTHSGHTSWLTCLWQIIVLAIPAFAILVVAMRRLAPTGASNRPVIATTSFTAWATSRSSPVNSVCPADAAASASGVGHGS